MKKSNNLFLLSIAIFALLFFIINESFSYFIGFEKAKNEAYERDKLFFSNLKDAQAKNILILATVLSKDDYVIEGYKKNNPKLIQEHIAPIWESVKEKKLTYEIHFFKPPAESFVNFSNFKSIGADVASVRTDIAWITSSFKSSTHALMCKTYAGYRATLPIIDTDGTMLGGLSLGKKIDWVPEAIKEKTKHDAFLIYTKQSTNSLMTKYYKNFIQDKELVGDYILANKTVNVSIENIKNIDYSKDIQNIEIADKNYILFTYPIIDFNKELMGYLCTITQLEEFKDRFIVTVIKDFIIVLLTVILIVFLARKRTKVLFKQINYIKNITNNIKNRDFIKLYNLPKHSKADDTTLIELENNIVAMGLELEKRYKVLTDENKEKTQQLIEKLYSDELTSLANRNALFEELNKNKSAFVAIFNIRAFKEINDVFGFETGNFILQELAFNFKKYIEEYSLLAYRIGNDEFVIINSNDTISKTKFEELISDIINDIEETTFNFEDKNIHINLNVYAGICVDEHERLKKADMALTQAKINRQEFVVYSEKENTADMHLNNIKIINKVTQALLNDDIIVYYQPIVDRDKNINKYEALVRMQDGEEILSPYFFLDIAKKTKHYDNITKVVIQKTFAKFKESSKSFSINITSKDILNKNTIKLITDLLSKCKEPHRAVFELVESDDLYNLIEIEEFIQNIKNLGAKIAIDDFGTGYSNFSYMMKIKPDYIKIDGSLIRNINQDRNAYQIVKTIIAFANNLDMKIIAEFVHSQEIYEICKALGVDEFQGYYFGEPKGEL